jgi:hypothetical protein
MQIPADEFECSVWLILVPGKLRREPSAFLREHDHQ